MNWAFQQHDWKLELRRSAWKCTFTNLRSVLCQSPTCQRGLVNIWQTSSRSAPYLKVNILCTWRLKQLCNYMNPTFVPRKESQMDGRFFSDYAAQQHSDSEVVRRCQFAEITSHRCFGMYRRLCLQGRIKLLSRVICAGPPSPLKMTLTWPP